MAAATGAEAALSVAAHAGMQDSAAAENALAQAADREIRLRLFMIAPYAKVKTCRVPLLRRGIWMIPPLDVSSVWEQ
ncbi:MAG: hypothetical protein LBU72_03265 [Burkholderiaceae bacterium]|nr:hypothetical protein [Burkholderiaceae bacterium]